MAQVNFVNQGADTLPIFVHQQNTGDGRKSIELNVIAIIPSYNEERFIGSVVLKALKYVDNVIVIDDGSTDATAEVAEAAGAFVLQHDENLGKGFALNTGFRKARELVPDVLVTIDADGQHVLDEISLVIAPIILGHADIAIGSRYIEKQSKVPLHRIAGHWLFNRIIHFTSGVQLSDSQSGYRAFSRNAVERISFLSSGFSVEAEMQFIARENNLRLVEVPITILYDDPPKRSVIAHGLSVLNGIFHLIGQYRPMLFFGIPGLILISTGIGWGLWVIEVYGRIQELATGHAMISMLLLIIGLTMLSTGFILHSIRGLMIDFFASKIRSR